MRISELSRRVDVSVETLRAWERRYGVLRPRRSSGNTRLYSALDEARVRVMKRYIEQQLPVAQAAEMAMAAPLRLRPGTATQLPEKEKEQAIRGLVCSLRALDETSADRMLQQLLGDYAVTAVLREVLIPCMADIGRQCERGQLATAHEHFASHFVQARLNMIARGWDRGLGPRAILAAAPGDYHTVGLTCLGIALSRLGWRIVFLGAATPIEVISDVLAATETTLVAISASIDGIETHVAELRALADGTPLAIGGPATSPALARRARAIWLAEPIEGATKLTLDHRLLPNPKDRASRVPASDVS